MYFSKYRQTVARKLLILVVLIILTVWFLTPVQWLQPAKCLVAGFFVADGTCGSHSSDWNILYHLGGNGPWVPMNSPLGLSSDLPAACHVEQVHMLARHAERYPTKNAGARHIRLLNKLKDPKNNLRGPLGFLRDWSYFAGTTNASFEDLTSTGPYAGTLQAQKTGARLRSRYGHLIKADFPTKFWSCSSPRDIETATSFANGFFGRDWRDNDQATLEIIPETSHRGADTLTPGDTCHRYREDKIEGHDHGYAKLAEWQTIFSRDIAHRLAKDGGAPALTPIETYGMMELCGFEILSRGSSPWCDVFTHKEWLDFEYARDVLHYYRAGPGNKYAGVMGWLWLNATSKLLTNDDIKDVFFSFVHDSDIVATIAALGLFDEANATDDLPTNRVNHKRRWKTSDIVPMGGHLIFEKIVCRGESVPHVLRQPHVRVFINDALYDLEKLVGSGGIAGSTTLESLSTFVLKRGKQFGNFGEVCGLADEMPNSISFLQQ